MDTFGAYAIPSLLAIMLLKEAGVPLPVPSDLIMISAGVQAAVGGVNLIALVLAIEAAIVVGGATQFAIARGPGRSLLYRYGRYLGLTRERLDSASGLFRRRGATAVFLSLNLPGARAGVVPGAGLSGMSFRTFLPAMIAGSSIFYAWHIALGYAIGPAAELAIANLNLLLIAGLVGLGLLGIIGWAWLRRRRRSVTGQVEPALAAARSWTDAACPGCLAISVLRNAMPQEANHEPTTTGPA